MHKNEYGAYRRTSGMTRSERVDMIERMLPPKKGEQFHSRQLRWIEELIEITRSQKKAINKLEKRAQRQKRWYGL